MKNTEADGEALTNDDLYLRQVAMLDVFLKNHAISQKQYNKSFGDLTAKMYPDKTEIPHRR